MVYPERLELDSSAKNSCGTMKDWQPSWNQQTVQQLYQESLDSCEADGCALVPPNTPLLPRGDSESPGESPGECSHQQRAASHDTATSQTEEQLFINQRISELVRAMRERAQRIRWRLELPPKLSSLSSEYGESLSTHSPVTSHTTQQTSHEDDGPQLNNTFSWPQPPARFPCQPVVDPDSTLYVSWLFVVTLCFVYNCWVIPLRCTFSQNTGAWLALDCSADLVYLLDLTLVKPKMSFLDDGFWVKDPVLTKRNYLRNTQFKMDAISLLPLDIICAVVGSQQILFRLPRVLKVHTFWECYNRLDSMLPSPYMVRMVRTLIYMLYLIHLNACAYYAFSVWQGLGANGWVFSGSGSPYIRCFYFATKTATSIGKNPKPETEEESLFMTCSWLMGVFVFAILIGQMRDIVVTATQSQTEYRKLVDETVEYMRRLSLPKELQERVKLWFHFTWEQQHALDERRIIDTLPRKLKTDIALQVHMHTLSKVQLFHDCDEALLRELVLKLRPIIFLPGDYICHKGEVGKEMYIVKSGVVEVLHGAASCEVLATLSEGSVFGEISLLALCGGNRRTADVRSRGFSILFVLSKADLNDSIVHYPEAQQILKKKARSLMKQNALREKQMQGSQGKNTAFTNSQTPVKTQRLMCSTVKESKKCRRQKKMTCGKNQNAECDSQNSRRTCLSDHNKASHRDAIGLSGERSSKMTTGTVCRLQLLEDEENTFECTVSVHRTMSQ